MSTWTYACCHTCKKRLLLEKFLGYRAHDPGAYRLALKARSLAAFFKKHARHDIEIFDEHRESIFHDTINYQYDLEAEDLWINSTGQPNSLRSKEMSDSG